MRCCDSSPRRGEKGAGNRASTRGVSKVVQRTGFVGHTHTHFGALLGVGAAFRGPQNADSTCACLPSHSLVTAHAPTPFRELTSYPTVLARHPANPSEGASQFPPPFSSPEAIQHRPLLFYLFYIPTRGGARSSLFCFSRACPVSELPQTKHRVLCGESFTSEISVSFSPFNFPGGSTLPMS